MKFLTKINRNYFFLLTVVLFAVSIGGYFTLRAIIRMEAKESLQSKATLIYNQIAQTGQLPDLPPLLEVKKNTADSTEAAFKVIYLRNKVEDEMEPYLQYSTHVKINNEFYAITIRQFMLENEDLATLLGTVLFILLFAAFGISFFLTKKMNKTVWTEFKQNLQKIEEFSFRSNRDLTLSGSTIEEFDRLNKVINHLTDKLKSDYLSLKEFSENASHEIKNRAVTG